MAHQKLSYLVSGAAGFVVTERGLSEALPPCDCMVEFVLSAAGVSLFTWFDDIGGVFPVEREKVTIEVGRLSRWHGFKDSWVEMILKIKSTRRVA